MKSQSKVVGYHINIAQNHLFAAICDSFGVSTSSVVNNFIIKYNQMHYPSILNDPAATLATKRCDPAKELNIFAELFLRFSPIQKADKRRRGKANRIKDEHKAKMFNVQVTNICEVKESVYYDPSLRG